jgi:hypothetical protein
VDILDTRDKLVGEEEDGLQRELAVAEVEQVFQAGAEEIEDHGVVVALGAKPADKRDADAAGERLVDAGLIFKLWVLGLDALELDGNLFAGDDVGAFKASVERVVSEMESHTEVDIAKAAGADLTAYAVFITDSEIL